MKEPLIASPSTLPVILIQKPPLKTSKKCSRQASQDSKAAPMLSTAAEVRLLPVTPGAQNVFGGPAGPALRLQRLPVSLTCLESLWRRDASGSFAMALGLLQL